jgi:NitT/TauT family transport system permease protein
VSPRARDTAVVVALLLLLWEGVARLQPRGLAGPIATVERGIDLATTTHLWEHVGYTLGATISGFALGAVPGIVLPALLRGSTTTKQVLSPFLAALYAAPKIAFAPVFVVWFGIGLGSKVALVASVVFFLVFFLTRSGIERVSEDLVHTARVLGADDRRVFRDVVLPSTLPYVFTGLRLAAPQALGVAVVGEMISSNRGLGFVIQTAAADFDPAGVFVGIALLVVVVVTLNVALDRLERRVLAWRPQDVLRQDARASL